MAAIKPIDQPVAITFLDREEDARAARLNRAAPAPTPDGRTGQVPAGCVFWMEGSRTAFTTIPEDHANCSVGSYTHGFLPLEEAAGRGDVAAILEAGWVDESAFPSLPHMTSSPKGASYAPADEVAHADVLLARINAFALMSLTSAVPDLRIEGKPQCHIIPLAAEQGVVAASVGCALSRARTGMRSDEMTVAIPWHRLEEVVTALEKTVALDRAMARYAAADAKRFA